eukprot:5590183-Pleurochrysis_carterae.AAC.1
MDEESTFCTAAEPAELPESIVRTCGDKAMRFVFVLSLLDRDLIQTNAHTLAVSIAPPPARPSLIVLAVIPPSLV